ncbi:MAG: hypothetical protein IJA10_01560 [Lachnospiraceae bacterium]|nr:hypothetical protein [Lachnospiraceae bacterium]
MGVTKSNIVTIDIVPDLQNEIEFEKFVHKIEELDKDPVQVDLYLKTHGLDQVEGLKDYILNNDKLNMGSVNELINTQTYTNIANQAHGISGVNKAIKEYKRLSKESTIEANRFVERINDKKRLYQIRKYPI